MTEPTASSGIEFLYHAAIVRSKVNDLGVRISEEMGTEDLLLVSLLSGSVVFVADLVRAIPEPVRYEFIQVESTAQEGGGGEILRIEYPIPFELRDMNVVLVRDVTSSGVIETYLTQQLREMGVRQLRVATLIDLAERRTTDFKADYHVFTPRGVGTLVGYGLKQGGMFGNLPYIGYLTS